MPLAINQQSTIGTPMSNQSEIIYLHYKSEKVIKAESTKKGDEGVDWPKNTKSELVHDSSSLRRVSVKLLYGNEPFQKYEAKCIRFSICPKWNIMEFYRVREDKMEVITREWEFRREYVLRDITNSKGNVKGQ